MFAVAIRIVATICILYLGAGAYAQVNLMHLLNAPQSTDQDPRMFEGLEFRNSHDVAIFAQEEDRDKIFPWVRHVEEWQALAILSLAAGFSGGVVRDIKAIYDRDEAHKNTWLIGLVLGPAILLVSVVYPAIIAEGKWQLRPASIIAVCFLGGVFAQQAWAYLQAAADKTFSRRNGT